MANDTIKGEGDVYQKDLYGDLSKSAKEVLPLLEAINVALQSTVKTNTKLVNIEPKDISSLNQINEGVENTNKAFKKKLSIDKKISTAQKQLQKDRLAEIKITKDREKAFDRFEVQQQKALKTAIKTRKATIDNANAFKTLTKRTNTAQARFKRLSAQYGETDIRTKKALRTFRKLDNQLSKINNTARDGRRDVGRYGKAFSGLRSGIKSGIGALGLAAGIAGIGRALKDTFNRIREFDKELQNIAGITGIARKDLKSLEKSIISVAGSSIKTSNEVAQLASTLFTLGKTEKEVKLLLKPVNDLSIALGATSEESADFLGQTLNAFGKGAESGQEFADIIAKVRTSTSLDFTRIKDALGFVAPTANALGLSLGQVSAQVGVLQDNGIKAARAGRLLNTSFARLVKQGKTLDEALEEINNSQNKVSTATTLFGAESFTLGVILADNVEKTANLANEFDNLSEGSLKKLTDEQLKSLDAKFKILDSTWEKFILSLDSGNSVIGDLTRNITEFLGEAITGLQNLDLIAKSTFDGLIKFRNEELSRTLDGGWVTETGVNINKIREEFDKIPLDKIAKNVDKVREGWIDLLGEDRTDAALLFTQYIRERTQAEKELSVETDVNTVATEGNSNAKKKNAKTTRELTGLIEKQAKVVSDLNTDLARATSEEEIFSISFDIKFEKEELESLKRIASSTREEFEKQQIDLIEDGTERQIAKLEDRYDKLINLIRSNSKTTTQEKIDLEEKAAQDLENKVTDLEIKKGQDFIKLQSDLAKAEFEQRRSGFKTEEAFEKEKAAQFKAIRIKSIDEELELLKIANQEKDQLKIEQLKAERASLFEFEKQTQKDFSELQQATLDLIERSVQARSDTRQEELSKELSETEKQQDRLRELADKGVLGADQSLAAEEKKQAELERQKQQEARNQELRTAGFKILSALLEQGKSPQEAIPEVGVLLGALPAVINAIPTFFEGTEDTGKVSNALDSKGGRLSMLHDNERVIDKKNNMKMGGVSNDEAANIVQDYNRGVLGNLYDYNQPKLDEAINTNWKSNQEILNKFESLENTVAKTNNDVKRAIENKPVITDVTYNKILNELLTVMESNGKKHRTISKPKRRL